MVFCRCQFVINSKWQDQSHIFETKKAIIGNNYSKGFTRSMRSWRLGLVTHHRNRETICQACQYRKKTRICIFGLLYLGGKKTRWANAVRLSYCVVQDKRSRRLLKCLVLIHLLVLPLPDSVFIIEIHGT